MRYRFEISRGKVIGLTVLFLFVGYLAYQSSCAKNRPDYPTAVLKTVPQEYWDLFPDSIRKKLKVSVTITSKLKNPVSQFFYNRYDYVIDVFKIDSINKPLSKSVFIDKVGALNVVGLAYNRMGADLFSIYYAANRHKASSIKISLQGDAIDTLIKNDSTLSLYSNFKILSVKYDKSDTPAIWAMSEGKYPAIPTRNFPMDITFIKKHKAVYFIAMSVNKSAVEMEPNKLNSLIFGK